MQHFDLCVIGSGTGNALINKQFAGWSVALVDGAPRFGGTCLNAGCIPSKMFAYPADIVHAARTASRLGVDVGPISVRWDDLRSRVFERLDALSASGEQWRQTNRRVALFRERAHFVAPKVLQVGDERISADSFVIAAGSRPTIPAVPGADDPALADRLHTSETIMRLPTLPRSLVIVGGGMVAAEFAHVFAAFGTQVTLLHRGEVLLRRADEAVARRFTDLTSERVNLRLRQNLVSFEDTGAGTVLVGTVDADGIEYGFEGEHVLIAIGRTPNGDTLNLDATGVAQHEDGRVVVDEFQRTTGDGIYALGDVSTPKQLKHVANHEMRIVRHNLLHPDDLTPSDHRFVPQAVFGGPQVAWVGLTEQEAREQGVRYVVGERDYGSVAYGWAMEDTEHFAKVLADPATGRLLGAHIIGPEASTLIQPLVQAMSFGLDASAMARDQYWIHPALTEVVENALLALRLES